MPNMNDFFDSKWLKVEDLGGREIPVVIARVEVQELGDERKPVMFFEGKKKGLALNKTNAGRIAKVHGNEMNAWAGKDVVLYPDETQFQGQLVPCIRLRVPQPPPREPGEDNPVDW